MRRYRYQFSIINHKRSLGRKSKIRIMRSLEDIQEDKSAHLLFRASVMWWRRTVIRPRFCCMFATRNNRYNNNRNTGIPSQSNNFTATVLVQKSYKDHTVKSQLFIFVPPACFHACFDTGFGFVSGFEEGYPSRYSCTSSQGIFQNPKFDEVIEGKRFLYFGL
jgi:hypothetical protein